MARWELSPLARTELEAVLDYLAADSGEEEVAARVAGDFMAALDILAETPGMGWRRRHMTGSEIRWWRVHSYLLVYDPTSRPLRVIRILHGSRDLERAFPLER